MKVYYMNDEKVPVTVQVNGKPKNTPEWDHIKYERFQPQEGRVIEFDAPEGSIPYIKRWETRQILITYIDEQVAQSISSSPTKSGAV